MVANQCSIHKPQVNRIERFFTPGLAQVAYAIGDDSSGHVAIIDPRRDIEEYVAWANRRGVRITDILETPVHADFVSGSLELAARTGASIHTSRLGEQTFPHQPLDDGDEVSVGHVRLRAMWTPGQTPEHMSFLLFEPGGIQPTAIFSGDALFVGEVGRPDLLGAEQTDRLVHMLYDTVIDRLSALPDDVVVYPGHTAGSSCGRSIGDAPTTTIGQEKRFNYAFKSRSREEFAAGIMAGMPRPPAYYPTMKRLNKAGAPLIGERAVGEALTVAEVKRRRADGALVVDTRSAEAFNAGHVPDAYFAGLGPDFVNWMGWFAPYDRDLVLVCDDQAAFDEAQTELRRIGLDRVAGFLYGGVDAWSSAGEDVRALPQASAQELNALLEQGQIGQVLDVRTASEWRNGHIAGAVHRFAGDIVQREMLAPNTGPVAVICASGYRSTVAASVLQGSGNADLIVVDGGMDAWESSGYPVTSGE